MNNLSEKAAHCLLASFCDDSGVEPHEVLLGGRRQDLVDIRERLMYTLVYFGWTYTDIAKFLNYSDHTTVSHHMNKEKTPR